MPAGECDGRQVRHPGRVQLLCDGPAAPGGRVSQQQAAASHHHLHRPAAHAAQMGQVSSEHKYIKGYKHYQVRWNNNKVNSLNKNNAN